MSQSQNIGNIRDSIEEKQEDYILTMENPDCLCANRHQIDELYVDWQYCIMARADHEDPKETIIYKQLMNIKEAWETKETKMQQQAPTTSNLGMSELTNLIGHKGMGGEGKDMSFDFMWYPGYNNVEWGKDGYEDNYYIWLININDDLKAHMTEFLDFKVFHNKKQFLRQYFSQKNNSYEPVKDWMTQTIMQYLLKDEFDIDRFTQEGLILHHFPVHEFNERRTIAKFWKRYWWQVFTHPLRPSNN